MASYVTRIELYGSPSWGHYEKLHKEMEQRGFLRTITSSKEVTYDLPSATYYCTTGSSKSDVLHEAKAAADASWSDNGVLVIESNGCTWDGLRVHNNRRFA